MIQIFKFVIYLKLEMLYFKYIIFLEIVKYIIYTLSKKIIRGKSVIENMDFNILDIFSIEFYM